MMNEAFYQAVQTHRTIIAFALLIFLFRTGLECAPFQSRAGANLYIRAHGPECARM